MGTIEGQIFFDDSLLVEPATNPVTVVVSAADGDSESSETIAIDATIDTIPVAYMIVDLEPGTYSLEAEVVAVDGDPDRADEVAIEEESREVLVPEDGTADGYEFIINKLAPDDSTVVLPPDSSGLFEDGKLQEHNFAESSFREDQVGTPVSQFDLVNADTSNVETMRSMFFEAESFNQDIGGWDTSNVEIMQAIFRRAISFNQDIGGWDTSNVEGMELMFQGAELFNQDIGGWDTSNVEDMSTMFRFAKSFNQDISGWDTSNVETMSQMFLDAESFDQNISGWCVEDTSGKPSLFDKNAGFEDDDANQPNWGEPC